MAEAEALLTVLQDEFGKLPIFVVGSSMGGYVALSLARTEKRVGGAAALITSGVWQEPSVNAPGARAFLEAQRPNTHAEGFAPTPLLLLSGDSDPTFPLEQHHLPTASILSQAYDMAGCPENFREQVYPGVGHYTSQKMRDDVVAWVTAQLNG